MGPTNEPIVPLSSRPPPGYRLIPKGNPYITLNCRKQTHASGQKVYQVVKGPNRAPVGIRVPISIYDNVLAQFHATKEDRAHAVHKRDDKLEDKYRDAVLEAFPRVPRDIVGRIVKHAMVKKSGRVGRTGSLSIEEKAVLGTMAHIRHVHTSYDKLLKSGVSKQRARKETHEQIMKKAAEWGFRPRDGGHHAHGRGRSGKETRRQVKKDKRRVRRRESLDQHDSARSRPRCGKGQNSAPIEISDDSDDQYGVRMALPLRSKPTQNLPDHHEGSRKSAGCQKRVPSVASMPRSAGRGFATTRSMAKARGQNMDRIYTRSLQFSDDDDDDIGEGDGSALSDSDDVYWISSDEDSDDADDSYGEEEDD